MVVTMPSSTTHTATIYLNTLSILCNAITQHDPLPGPALPF